jgi:hypothetical protein
VNRRNFFQLAAALPLAAAIPFELEGLIAMPTRKIFLPPKGGWHRALYPGLEEFWRQHYSKTPINWPELYALAE